MEDIMKVAFLFLVLMIIGTGFIYVYLVAGLSPFRNFCIRSLLLN